MPRLAANAAVLPVRNQYLARNFPDKAALLPEFNGEPVNRLSRMLTRLLIVGTLNDFGRSRGAGRRIKEIDTITAHNAA